MLELESHHSSLTVLLQYSYPSLHTYWLYLGENRCAWIASCLSAAVPKLDVSLWNIVHNSEFFNSSVVCFDFIKADDIRVFLVQKELKCVLREDSIYTIYVPLPYRYLLVLKTTQCIFRFIYYIVSLTELVSSRFALLSPRKRRLLNWLVSIREPLPELEALKLLFEPRERILWVRAVAVCATSLFKHFWIEIPAS
jgi:hypothetical protein